MIMRFGVRVEILNQSKQKTVSIEFLKKWIHKIVKELKSEKIKTQFLKKKLIIAFITEKKMKELNRVLRHKNKATDVLSFSSNEHCNPYIGELALCPIFISKKARRNKTSVREETAYIVLHGILHLLGYEHEKSEREEQKMFYLQDKIYYKLRKTIHKQ